MGLGLKEFPKVEGRGSRAEALGFWVVSWWRRPKVYGLGLMVGLRLGLGFRGFRVPGIKVGRKSLLKATCVLQAVSPCCTTPYSIRV